MRVPSAISLSRLDHNLLAIVQRIVPAKERDEWVRAWYGELWHARHCKRSSGLAFGLLHDAVWLRCEAWRNAYGGSASLCLASLLALCVLSLLPAFVALGTLSGVQKQLGREFFRFALQTPFVVFVAFATSSRRHVQKGTVGKKAFWFKRQLFFIAKTSLVLVLAYLCGMDICQSMHSAYPMTSAILQTLCFVLLALLGLRWTFQDQQHRCKQCLRSLTTPCRVGRPSHNLLEWNGTELLCRDGHGLLSVPEMETSWCQASRWSYQEHTLA
jgi:hypothetical protein